MFARVEDFLDQYRSMTERISELETDRKILYDQLTKTTASYDGDGTSGGDPLDRKRNLQAKYADLGEKLDRMKSQAENKREYIREWVEDNVTAHYPKRVLQLHYCDLVGYKEIAEMIGYGISRVYQFRQIGISKAKARYKPR